MPSPYSVQRFVVSYGARGSRAGNRISCPPIAFISSRTTRSMLRSTRSPSGSQLYSPGATGRTYPARTSSLWLGTSASAGSSRRVRRNNSDIRVITAGKPNGCQQPSREGGKRDAGLQLPGVDRVLDFLSVCDLFGGVADEQRRAADDDGHPGHPQQAVGVAVV